jgi:ABC-type uncharacterized transport system ATPase subunit
VLTLIHLKDDAQRTAGLLSHGQKQWLEIGMLLMQDPKLLLLDEPVAGMTDEETERTAELFLSLEGKHSLVVVEHDMKFVDQLTEGRKKVTVLHEGSVLAEGCWPTCRPTKRSSRSTWAMNSMLKVEGLNQYYGGSHILRGLSFEAKLGEVTVVLGRNGVGKTTLLKSLMGVVPVKAGSIELDGSRHHPRHQLRARAPRRGLRAAGARDLQPPDGGREPAHGPGQQARQHADPGRAVRAVPHPQAVDAPPWRRPVGRPAAAAGHRARAGGRPQAADAGRADRGHPAQHHQGHRPRHPHAGRPQDHGHRAGRAVLRLRRRTGRPVPGDGARRDRAARPMRGRHGSRGRATAARCRSRRQGARWPSTWVWERPPSAGSGRATA